LQQVPGHFKLIKIFPTYTVSAEVEFPGFKGDNKEHPNRVLLSTDSESFQFQLPNLDTKYTARRKQLPLIPAFAFTSHNSQGRTLERACIDLASCTTIQSAYVMLSRVKLLKGLHFAAIQTQSHSKTYIRRAKTGASLNRGTREAHNSSEQDLS
jgi:hypothetical protein